MSIYEAVLSLVGAAPAGYDILVWVFSAVLLIYLVCSAFSIVGSLVNWIAGK